MFRFAMLAFALAASGLVAASAHSTPSEPAKKEFLILNDDGYGTSDCLAKASACGKIVADAWCESKGYAKAVAYRPASAGDMTQSITPGRSLLNETFVISCTE